jgi:hypothetical protein
MAWSAFPALVGCVAGVVGLFVSGFLAAPSTHVSVWGVWYGVVV